MAEKTKAKQIVRRGPYPELTLASILVGYFLGAIITISMGYASLILGFSITGSTLAAILGFGVLRGVMHRNSIIENNINQTIASAVNGASSGIMFSVPALFILHVTNFSPALMVFGTIAGGILGIAFIIPLRKQMIDFERHPFPSGIAVATILKSPGAGVKKALLLLSGALISGIVNFISQATGVTNFNLGHLLGMPVYMNGIWYISLLTIGVGYISGKGGIFFIIGGFVCYWLLAPVLAANHLLISTDPAILRSQLFEPVGIGMLIGGALMGIVLALPLIYSAIRSMQQAAKMNTRLSSDEMPIKLLYVGIIGAGILLFIIAVMSTQQIGIVRGALIALAGIFWIWVSGVILSECVGRTDWSPLSGMTLIAITIFIFIASGIGNDAAIISSVMVGAAACVAMAQATDLMQDLKTGYLVGASPRKQQIGQFLGSWLGPILVVALVFILNNAYHIGSDRLPAPQGEALASMIRGILGGHVAIQKYVAGAGIGALLSATGVGGLGILVGLGFYLPFNIVLTYSLGTALRLIIDWRKGPKFSNEVGIPLAAGLIVGEALVGVGFALYMVFTGL
ncbi:MAG TPA: OPT/YSL family transporter [Balneolales bacterium]|nr:OPT/YSL family transporter [Balneolales bacterium]